MDIKNLPWYGQIGVFLIISAVVFALFYFLYYEGEQSKIARRVKEIERVQGEINKSKNDLKRLDEIRAKIAMYKEELKKLDQILPKEKKISEILTKIQSLISGTQQEFKRMSKGSKKKKKLFVEFSYTINTTGNYHNLGTFFDQLSSLKKIFNVTNLSITPFKKKVLNQQFTINSTFRLSTYIQRKKVKKTKKRRRR